MLAASSQAANVALGKKVYASSNQQPPELAVDDNLGTRWESKASDGDNQWFYVDLEKGTIIDHLKIVWEGAYGKHYKIHVADEDCFGRSNCCRQQTYRNEPWHIYSEDENRRH